MRYLTNDEKRAKAEVNAQEQAKAAENRRRIIALHEELLPKMLSRPEYSDETKASLERGFEAYIKQLRGQL